ncbi:MAG TPA: OsmC family protein, partial [Vicinamibacterales bacterium]
MTAFPHEYVVTLVSSPRCDVYLSANRVPVMRSAAPAEFGGPGDRWSPETLLVAAVGDCFAITFQAMARAAELPWKSLRCEVTGTLDRQDGGPQFTRFELRARLGVPAGTSEELAHRSLERAERGCLIARSLKAPVLLTATIEQLEPAQV